jgi:predicted lipoprotein with Yx(FWY)xxD motif
VNKNSTVIGIVIVIIVVVGGFAVFHKSSKKTPASTSSSTQSSASTVNNAVLVTKTSASIGSYLAEPNGDALYTYGGDSSGVSTVTGSLLASWPAYQDKGATTGLPANVGTIKRTDNGEIQYTYKGMPLYTFVSDSAGQVTGNGVSNFSVATPEAASASQSSSSSSNGSATTGSSTQSTGNSYSNPY